MKTFRTAFVISALCLSFFACISDDESLFQDRYTSKDLLKLDGDDFKHWAIEAYYDNYKYQVLNAKSACYADDVFIFRKGSNQIQVISGEVSCMVGDPEDEVTTASYDFYEDQGSVFISIGKAITFDDVTKNTFFTLQLLELSDTKMIFGSGEKGDYKVALVLVAV